MSMTIDDIYVEPYHTDIEVKEIENEDNRFYYSIELTVKTEFWDKATKYSYELDNLFYYDNIADEEVDIKFMTNQHKQNLLKEVNKIIALEYSGKDNYFELSDIN